MNSVADPDPVPNPDLRLLKLEYFKGTVSRKIWRDEGKGL
jgi:hypothetical protein